MLVFDLAKKALMYVDDSEEAYQELKSLLTKYIEKYERIAKVKSLSESFENFISAHSEDNLDPYYVSHVRYNIKNILK